MVLSTVGSNAEGYYGSQRGSAAKDDISTCDTSTFALSMREETLRAATRTIVGEL